MTDTQWPRYEVFKQDTPHKAHEAVGTVHAPDAEMALLNARDVFVRRPSAVSLWVVPATAIFSLTAEEIALNPDRGQEMIKVEGVKRPFLIFTKALQRRSMTFVKHVGEEAAVTAQEAVHKAIESGRYDNDNVWVWWAVPAAAISRSEEDEATIASMFAPANDKKYRQQSAYGFVSPTRKARGKKGKE